MQVVRLLTTCHLLETGCDMARRVGGPGPWPATGPQEGGMVQGGQTGAGGLHGLCQKADLLGNLTRKQGQELFG